MAVFHPEAAWRLHPAIRCQDPEGGDQCADRDQQRGAEVSRAAHALPAEQHDAEEAGFQEERRHDFIGEERAGDRPCELGECRPVGAELVSHDHARHHAHPEADREHLRPVDAQVLVVRFAGLEPAPFKHGDKACEADAQRRKNDVKRDGECELQSRQVQRGECHRHTLRWLALRLIDRVNRTSCHPGLARNELNRFAGKTSLYALKPRPAWLAPGIPFAPYPHCSMLEVEVGEP
jgi:hypothetical protein